MISIRIRLLSGELFKNIDIINRNNSFNYDEVKELFNLHIISNKYYKIISDNNQDIYTNLYDSYVLKNTKNIILNNELNIIFLPYKKIDVDEIKLWFIHHDLLNIHEPFIHNFSNELLEDKLFALMMVNHGGSYFYNRIGLVAFDKEIIKETILSLLNNEQLLSYDNEKYYNFLEDYEEYILDDKDIVLAAVKKSCSNFEYASIRLKEDKEIVITSIINCFDTSPYDDMATSFYNLVSLVNSMKELDETINMIIDNTTLKYDSDVLQTVIQKKQELFLMISQLIE
jgi:hypothetical protein